MSKRRAEVAIALVLATAACRGNVSAVSPVAPSRPRARVSPAETLARSDVAAEAPRVLPGPVAACIRRVAASVPRELAGALAALEYTSAVEDGCRLALAIQLRDPALCDGAALSQVRAVCRSRAAIAAGAPAQCPAATLDRGADPVCTALARRAPPLCAAALPADALRCLAVASGAPERCAALDPLLRARCLDEVAALQPALGALHGAALPPGTATLRLTFGPRIAAGDDAGTAATTPLTFVARGAYTDGAGGFSLVDPARGWPGVTAFELGSERPIVGVALRGGVRAGVAQLAALRIVLPDGRVIEPAAGAPAQVRFSSVGAAPGASLAGTVAVQGEANGQPVFVELEFRTFVRAIAAREDLGVP